MLGLPANGSRGYKAARLVQVGRTSLSWAEASWFSPRKASKTVSAAAATLHYTQAVDSCLTPKRPTKSRQQIYHSTVTTVVANSRQCTAPEQQPVHLLVLLCSARAAIGRFRNDHLVTNCCIFLGVAAGTTSVGSQRGLGSRTLFGFRSG